MTFVMLRSCHGPSTTRPALTNRAQENAGRSGRDDRKSEKQVPRSARCERVRDDNFSVRRGKGTKTRNKAARDGPRPLHCLRAIDARRGECYVAHEKPQVQKADPSYLRASLSYRDVRQHGWSVTDLSGTAIVVVRAQPGMAVPLGARAFFRG